MSFSIRKKVVLGFAISVLALAGLGWLAFHTTRRLTGTIEWIAHAREVIAALDEGHAALADAVAAQRSYILIGDERFLEDFREVVTIVRDWPAKLRALTANEPDQQPRLDELEKLLARRLELLHERIRLRQEKGLQAAADAVGLHDAEELMEHIRA